jgi:hypothetical protein
VGKSRGFFKPFEAAVPVVRVAAAIGKARLASPGLLATGIDSIVLVLVEL